MTRLEVMVKITPSQMDPRDQKTCTSITNWKFSKISTEALLTRRPFLLLFLKTVVYNESYG